MAGKNDTAWEALFHDHGILAEINQNGFYRIDADTIKAKREPRLMTKFDHAKQRPDIFKDNELSIQPTAFGHYIIGRFDSYFTLPKDPNPTIERLNFPNFIETISPNQVNSEATGILCAYHGKLFDEVIGEQTALTIMGRMRTGVFDYEIDRIGGAGCPISVQNAQCEIDAGLESTSALALVEAKNHTGDDFLIRQLYYPYRLWQAKTQRTVTPIFMTHSDGIFSLYKFIFTDAGLYNSLILENVRHFQFGSLEIAMRDIVQIHQRLTLLPETLNIPFPQADSMARLIDLLWQFEKADGQLDKDEITDLQDFDERQADYYANAGRYLGLIDKIRDGVYRLSQKGLDLLAMEQQNRSRELAQLILSHKAFYDTFERYLENGQLPNHADVATLIQEIRPELSGDTPNRRASTVLGWLSWIIELPKR